MSRACKPSLDISLGFLLLVAWFGLLNGWKLLLTILSAAAAHECGHWLVLRLLGAKISGVRISLFGAVLETDSRQLSYGQELAAVLAGPAVNLLAAVLLARSGLSVAAGVHLSLAAFNLLPVGPLDGGRALNLLLCGICGPVVGERVACWVGRAAAAAQAVGLVWVMAKSGGNLWLLPAAAGMLAAAGHGIFRKEPCRKKAFL